MKISAAHKKQHRVNAGEFLSDTDLSQIWRIESGALRIDSILADGFLHFVCLCLPGDLIGSELMTGFLGGIKVKAIVPTALTEMTPDLDETHLLLKNSIAQRWARCSEAVSLRSGSAPSRIQRFLLMLTNSRDNVVVESMLLELPNFREIASLVDSTPETVCRVIGLFLKEGMLHERKPLSVRVNSCNLRAYSAVDMKPGTRRYALT